MTSDTRLWFEVALLPEGWARAVRLRIRDGRIAEVEHDVAAVEGDERHHAIALPGLANVHSHAFQRAMAGLTGQRGPENDNFWTWREVMYHFVGRLAPEDVLAISALAFVEMLESGSRASASSTTSITRSMADRTTISANSPRRSSSPRRRPVSV